MSSSNHLHPDTVAYIGSRKGEAGGGGGTKVKPGGGAKGTPIVTHDTMRRRNGKIREKKM